MPDVKEAHFPLSYIAVSISEKDMARAEAVEVDHDTCFSRVTPGTCYIRGMRSVDGDA